MMMGQENSIIDRCTLKNIHTSLVGVVVVAVIFPWTGASAADILACMPHVGVFRSLPNSAQLIENAKTDPKSLVLGLIDSAEKGNLNCIDTLLAAGASPNGDDIVAGEGTRNQTPLVAAAQNKRVDVIKKLLAAGADPNQRALRGSQPEDIGVPPIVAGAGSDEVVKVLIEKGADINAVDGNGMTALHWAVSFGNSDLVKELVNRGAEKDVKDRWGRTPLEGAIEKNEAEIIQFLSAN